MTFDQFRQLIADISHAPIEAIQEHSSFRDDIGIDSLQMVNLLVAVAEKTGVSLGNLTDSDDYVSPGNLYYALFGGN
ncbi:acyl carrier protein [Salinibacillus xinjiangensis]|uniref:Carrier domain-containing protein n=1 Tax=Salinibacillus xinjiangensis TaxID=1229268 RepID=A0A6G1X226_9BACI|nr:acyl carrier protein [Salinibacillus xinjiangensis]MRG85041.1 hypothetical protein [Salinibacillus xinjiangensis]